MSQWGSDETSREERRGGAIERSKFSQQREITPMHSPVLGAMREEKEKEKEKDTSIRRAEEES